MRGLDGVREMGRNVKLYRFIADIVVVAVFGTSHGLPLIDGFVGLQRAEARLIIMYKIILCNNPLLQSE